MKQKLIDSIGLNYYLKQIEVIGWINSFRITKNIIFININDGSRINDIQIVYKNNNEILNLAKNLKFHVLIKVIGVVKKNKNDDFEIDTKEIKIINTVPDTYPLQPKKQTFEFLRNNCLIRNKTKIMQAIFKIKNNLYFNIHKFFQSKNFTFIAAPVLSKIDAEGTGEIFEVKDNLNLFNNKIFLSVSGQLQAEVAAQSFQRVYTFGPQFRSDKSNTIKHATEFWMLEIEFNCKFINDLYEIIIKLLLYLVKQVIKTCSNEIKVCENFFNFNFSNKMKNIIEKNYKFATYIQCVRELKKYYKKHGLEIEISNENNYHLTQFDEKNLVNEIYQKPVFIYNYPANQKAFYMKQNSDNTVLGFDFLFPNVGELIGGSLRENNFEKLLNSINKNNINKKDFKWYLNLRKLGYLETGGFGLGFERLVMFITGATNIKDVILYPRTNKYFP